MLLHFFLHNDILEVISGNYLYFVSYLTLTTFMVLSLNVWLLNYKEQIFRIPFRISIHNEKFNYNIL